MKMPLRYGSLRRFWRGAVLVSWRSPAVWGFCLGLGFLALLVWQWQLLLATVLGMGVMGLVYWGQGLPWEQYIEEWYRLWHSGQRQLVLAVLSGAGTAFVAYLAIAIWQSTVQHWLAAGAILEGLAIAGIFLMLLSQMVRPKTENFEKSFAQLSIGHPIKRLLAVRTLAQGLRSGALDREQAETFKSCLQLMLKQETEMVVREAILQTLSYWQPVQDPLQTPSLGRSPLKLNNHRKNNVAVAQQDELILS
jgi:hypothetical protein